MAKARLLSAKHACLMREVEKAVWQAGFGVARLRARNITHTRAGAKTTRTTYLYAVPTDWLHRRKSKSPA
jgi:hypothetical protein